MEGRGKLERYLGPHPLIPQPKGREAPRETWEEAKDGAGEQGGGSQEEGRAPCSQPV